MAELIHHLANQQAELALIVEEMTVEDLLTPSRCAGWSVADVLLHLAQTNEAAVASLAGSFDDTISNMWDSSAEVADVDEWAALVVESERPSDPGDSAVRWRASADAQLAAFGSCDPHARVPWVVGDLAARTLASTRLSETWIHTNDVAVPLGVVTQAGDQLHPIARLAWRTIPYAFERAGEFPPAPVALRLDAPDGSIWRFRAEGEAPNLVEGSALEFCEVAAQRADGSSTSLQATGPDADRILRFVRTFA